MKLVREGIKTKMPLKNVAPGVMFVFNADDDSPFMVTNQRDESSVDCIELSGGSLYTFALTEDVFMADGVLNWDIKCDEWDGINRLETRDLAS